MSVQTRVIWEVGSPQEVINLLSAKGLELADLQTAPFQSSTDPITRQVIVDRFWVDTEAATNWIVFVEGYNPVSATIIS